MATTEYKLLDQVINYAKGHYVSTDSSFNDLRKIFKRCDRPDSNENIIHELCTIAFVFILESEDSVNEYTSQIVFMYKALEKILQGMYITELDDHEDIYEKAKASVIETLTQSLLIIVAKWYPDRDIQEPSPKIMMVRDKVGK